MIPDYTVDEIRRRWREFYPADQHDGIICPLCDSGSGEKGTGITEVPNTNGLLKCFACEFSGDVIQLYAAEHHLDFRAEFPKIVREMASLIGLTVEDDEPPIKVKGAAPSEPSTEPTSEPTIDLTPADDCLEQTDYLKRRGISIDTARHFHISFVKNYKHSDKWSPMPAIIIPLEPTDSFIARPTGKNVAPKHKSLNRGKTALFNPSALSENETVFVVEGVIDALSLYDIGFKNVVSVNGVANTRLLKNALDDANPKPKRLIFALDNDDAGSNAIPKFLKMIARFGIVGVDGSKISGDKKDANDLLRADRDLLRANCQAALEQAQALALPRERVFMRTTKDAFPDCPYDFDIPPGWFLDSDGVFEQKGAEASLTPVFPVKRLFNHFFQTTRYVLAFFDGTTWRETTVDADHIADANKALKLADHGIQTFAGAAKLLVVFFNKFLKLNFSRIENRVEYVQSGWHNDFNDFVLPGFKDYYAPSLEKMYGVGGSSEKWLAITKMFRNDLKCPLVRIMLDLSFAAPLLSVLNMRTFTTYLWGNSLSGKTASQKLAISAWGNPDKMKATFRATANGIEGAAAKSNNIPLMIDERQAADAKLDFQALIYALGEETGKFRMDKNGNLRPQKYWRMTILATGEDLLIEKSAALGAHNRILQIHLELDEALFDSFTTSFSPAKVHTFAENNFGHAGRLWIEKLMPYRLLNFANVKEVFAEFEKPIFREHGGKYSSEHLRYATLIAATDYLASKEMYGAADEDNPETKSKALEMATYVIGKLPTAASLADSTRSWEWFVEFVSSNRRHFTGNHLRDDKELKEPVFGTIRVSGGDIKKILLYPNRLRDEMKKARFPVEKCLADWRSRGWILSDKKGNNPTDYAHNGKEPTHLRMIVIPKEYANLIKIDEEADDDE